MQPTPTAPESAVSSGDRLSFTVFIAAALHGLLIFGLGFSLMVEPNTPPTFEVTLATHKSQEAPDKADYQAQFSQQASGTEDQARELTTNKPAPFADTRVNQVMPQPQTKAHEVRQVSDLNRIHTTAESTLQVVDTNNPEQKEVRERRDGGEREVPLVSAEVASLRAKLDRLQQEYSKRPRITRLTSVATVGSPEAAYLNQWRQTIEKVGNQNFPQQALQQGIFGQLRLATTVKSNGTIVSVEIMQSSGYSILDNAALQIVHMAAPFEPFPPEISKEWDQLEIIRTWRFEINGLSTAN